MQIDVDIQPALLLQRLEHGEKRLSFAVVNALNNTAKLIQKTQLEAVHADLTVRKSAFIDRRASKISFASVGKSVPSAEIYVDSANVQGSPLLLAALNVGGVRAPVKGKGVAVPIIGSAARPDFGAPVPTALRFTSLRLTIRNRIEGGKVERRKAASSASSDPSKALRYGLQGTYQVPGVGVFQQQGGSTHLIYAFVKDEKLPRKLDLEAIGKRVADEWFPKYLQLEVDATLARRGL
jgi:hypothetical protein